MIGDRVRSLREESLLSISELAEKSGVAKSYISSLERNIKMNPSINVLEKISKGLGVPLEKIVIPDKNIHRIDSEWINMLQTAINRGLTKKQFEHFILNRLEEENISK